MKQLFTILFFAISLTILSQNATNCPPVERFIEMTGRAEIEVIPDEIYLKISIREKVKKDDNAEIEQKELEMKQVLLNKGIDLKNLSLLNEFSGATHYWKKSSNIMKTKDFILKLSDAAKVGVVFEALDQMGIEDVSIQQLKHSKQDSLKKEMRIAAIKAAKVKIDYLLSAIDEFKDKIVEVREIEESEFFRPNVNQARSINSAYKLELNGGDIINTEFKKIKISSAIYLKYTLK